MSSSGRTTRVICFGSFELRLSSGELFKRGHKIRLQGQPFELLVTLAQRPAEVLTRLELRDAIWPQNIVVDFERGLNRAIKKVRDALGDSATNPHFIETLHRRGYRFIGDVEQESSSDTSTERASDGALSIGVLPFENADGSAGTDYLAEGFSEAITNTLSCIPHLVVVPRTTMVRYKGKNVPYRKIGRETKIRYLLTGTVAQLGNQVKVQAELVRPYEGNQIWGNQYRRSLREIGDIERHLIGEIAKSLQVELNPENSARIIKRQPINVEAYRLYLQGRYFWNRRFPQRALECFEQATNTDPACALAWAGLANAHVLYYAFQMSAPAQTVQRIREAAETALRMEPGTADARACLGFVNSFYDWDWCAGEDHFRKAIQLDPTSATAQAWFAHALSVNGRKEEALAVLTSALDCEPASPSIYVVAAQTLLQLGFFQDAIRVSRKALDLDSSSAIVLWVIGLAYLVAGMEKPAIAFLRRSMAHMPAPKVPVIPVLTWLGYAYGRVGHRDKAEKILAKLECNAGKNYISPYNLALIHFGLGEKDQGFKYLEGAWQDRSFCLSFFAPLTVRLANAEGDPRSISLLHRMNLNRRQAFLL